MGGASVELACSTRMRVYASDIFEPLVAFWQNLVYWPRDLIERVQAYYPLSRDRFYETQRDFVAFSSRAERGAAFYVLNRSSFSGTTLSGGMSPGHPRFTQSSIDRLKEFRAPNFCVEHADYQDAITEHSDAFLYLDPPYQNGQALYGLKGNAHKGFDHQTLARLLKRRGRWIMSYNDSPEIRELYQGYPTLTPNWTYGMGKNKTSREILIFSQDFLPLDVVTD